MADKKPISKAQQRAVTKYMKNHYYNPTLYIKIELKDKIQERAASQGMSISNYIVSLIEADLGM
jgi:hypothetical protein